jgi:sugar phosphate isomerase/epimerase
MSWPIIIHINTFEQGQTIEDACRCCVAWGYDGIEFRRKRAGVNEDAESYLDTIYRYTQKYKVQNVIFGSPGIQKAWGTEKEREEELNELIKFYELASQRFDLSLCNTFVGPIMNSAKDVPYAEYTKHGSYIAMEDHWKWAINSFREIGYLTQKLNFNISFETHMNYLNDTIDATLRLVKEIGCPNIGINLDYGNIIQYENPPSLEESIEKTSDSLFYVHLKNSIGVGKQDRIHVGLGDGDINNRQLLKMLKEKDYKGPLCIENPRVGDREWFARNDIKYLKTLIEEV